MKITYCTRKWKQSQFTSNQSRDIPMGDYKPEYKPTFFFTQDWHLEL